MRRIVMLMLVLAVSAVAAAPALAADPIWFEVRSPNFIVYTDAGEKRGRDVALRFEQMRAIFGQLFQKAKVTTGVPLKIVAFRNAKGLRQVGPVFEGKSVELAGMFLAGDGVAYIALDLSAYDPWQVVFHEYGHLLLNANSFDAPLWFDEGFAEYYSTIRVDRNEYTMGSVPYSVPQILQQERFLPVADLFSVDHESPTYNRGNHRSVFYAQSWLAVHYLRSDPALAEKLRNYLTLRAQKVEVAEAIQRAFGDAKQLDKDLQKHFSVGQALIYRIKLPAGSQDLAMQAKPLDPLDGRMIIAEFQSQSRHHQEEAQASFREVLKSSPDHPIALRGLGYALLRQGQWQEAGDYFRRAAAQDSSDARVHYFSAMLIQRQGMSDPEARAAMRKSLERAVELDPDYADAHGLLGLAYLMDRDMQKAVVAMRRALELKPREDAWAMNLANCYVALQQWDQATELLQRMTQSSRPRIATGAKQMLETVARMRANPNALVVGPLRVREPAAIQGDTGAEPEEGENAERAPAPAPPAAPAASSATAEPPPMANVLRFFRGTLLKVECGPRNRAVLTIRGVQREFTITAPDMARVSVGGKRRFSCDWRDVSVKGFMVADPEKGYLLDAIEAE